MEEPDRQKSLEHTRQWLRTNRFGTANELAHHLNCTKKYAQSLLKEIDDQTPALQPPASLQFA